MPTRTRDPSNCAHCHQPRPNAPRARFCSGACRQRAYRRRAAGIREDFPEARGWYSFGSQRYTSAAAPDPIGEPPKPRVTIEP